MQRTQQSNAATSSKKVPAGKLRLSRFETNALAKAKADLDALTDDADKFMSDNLTKFKNEVKVFIPENYGL